MYISGMNKSAVKKWEMSLKSIANSVICFHEILGFCKTKILRSN